MGTYKVIWVSSPAPTCTLKSPMDIDFYLLRPGGEGRIGMTLHKYRLPTDAPRSMCKKAKGEWRNLRPFATLTDFWRVIGLQNQKMYNTKTHHLGLRRHSY